VGGAFGSKASVTPRTAIVAIAARRVGRPVKLVTTRDQGFTVAVYRAETSANQYWMTRFNQWAQLTMMVEVSRNTQSV